MNNPTTAALEMAEKLRDRRQPQQNRMESASCIRVHESARRELLQIDAATLCRAQAKALTAFRAHLELGLESNDFVQSAMLMLIDEDIAALIKAAEELENG